MRKSASALLESLVASTHDRDCLLDFGFPAMRVPQHGEELIEVLLRRSPAHLGEAWRLSRKAVVGTEDGLGLEYIGWAECRDSSGCSV